MSGLSPPCCVWHSGLRKRFRRFIPTGGDFALPLDPHRVKGLRAPDNPDQWAHRCPLEPRTGVSAPASTKRRLRLSLWKLIDQGGDPGRANTTGEEIARRSFRPIK
ncbi:MAG: hypothetical protein AB2693_31030 [Candidatus Thiodiazotropha sp.]